MWVQVTNVAAALRAGGISSAAANVQTELMSLWPDGSGPREVASDPLDPEQDFAYGRCRARSVAGDDKLFTGQWCPDQISDRQCHGQDDRDEDGGEGLGS
jgi:hypothetical protein